MILLFFHQPAVHRHGDHLPRDELPALLERLFFAASSSPPQQGTSIRTTVTLLMSFFPDDLRQLFGIVHAVQLGQPTSVMCPLMNRSWKAA